MKAFFTTSIVLLSINLFAMQLDELESMFEGASNQIEQSNANIEYQASALTVVYGDELELLGVRNLSEALDFVPGIQTTISPSGASHLSIRGANQPHNTVYEKVKFFMDGVDIHTFYFNDFPIELIERIEVLRGAATALYGQEAYNGAINIVTKSSLKNIDNILAVEYGSFNDKKISTLLNYTFDNFSLGIDAYYQSNDKKVDAPNAIESILPGITATDFPRNKESLEGVDNKGIGINIYNDTWKYTFRYSQRDTQNYIGFFSLLDFNEEGYSKYETITTELNYKFDISRSLKLEADVGFLKYNYEMNSFLYLLEPNIISPFIKNPHYKVDYSKETIYTDLIFKSDYFKDHEIEFGIYASKLKVSDNDFYTNADSTAKIGYEFPTGSSIFYPVSDNLVKLSGSLGLVDVPNNQQKKLSYFIKDIYHFNDHLSFTFNLRLDDYEFFDEETSISIASVYTSDEKNIFKLKYARAYQLPSLFESFLVNHFNTVGNSELYSEYMDSFEFSYSNLQANQMFKLNTFYNVNSNLIALDNNPFGNQYKNNGVDQHSYGIEVEYTKDFNNNSKFLFNGSYVKYKFENNAYTHSHIETPNASKFLVHSAYIYPIFSSLTWSNILRYYGSQNLLISNEKIEATTLVDSVLRYTLSNDIELTLNIKNIFDEKYYYPSKLIGTPPMQREGRTTYINMQYNF